MTKREGFVQEMLRNWTTKKEGWEKNLQAIGAKQYEGESLPKPLFIFAVKEKE